MQTRDPVEDLLWEQLLHDDPDCQSAHRADGNQHCTHVVTHRLLSQCQEPQLVCSAQAQYTLSVLDKAPRGYCAPCQRAGRHVFIEDCWRIVPA